MPLAHKTASFLFYAPRRSLQSTSFFCYYFMRGEMVTSALKTIASASLSSLLSSAVFDCNYSIFGQWYKLIIVGRYALLVVGSHAFIVLYYAFRVKSISAPVLEYQVDLKGNWLWKDYIQVINQNHIYLCCAVSSFDCGQSMEIFTTNLLMDDSYYWFYYYTYLIISNN